MIGFAEEICVGEIPSQVESLFHIGHFFRETQLLMLTVLRMVNLGHVVSA